MSEEPKKKNRFSRTDLQYPVYVYFSRTSDVFLRRLAMKTNRPISRTADDIVKFYIDHLRKKNAGNDEQSGSDKE